MLTPRLNLIRALCAAALLFVGFHSAFAETQEQERPARPRAKGAITRPKYDPNAEKVDLFAGQEDGRLEVTVIARNSRGGNILIENKTDQPLTVVMPEAVVGVQVLKQFGGGMGGGFDDGGGFGDGGMGGGAGGGAQSFGGGMGGMGGGMMGGMGGGMGGMGGGMGGGFFSIPPEKVVRTPYRSVCLEHGLAEPHPRIQYRLVKVEEFSKNPALGELLRLLADPRVDQHSLQAAAWHLTDEMSWQELAAKDIRRLGGLGRQPYFQPGHIHQARQFVALAQGRARESAAADHEQPTQPVTTRVRR